MRAIQSSLTPWLALLAAACCGKASQPCPAGAKVLPDGCACHAEAAAGETGPAGLSGAGGVGGSVNWGGQAPVTIFSLHGGGGAGAACIEPPAEIAVAPLALIPQEKRLYCWAASAQMLTKFFTGNDIKQCEQATAAIKFASGQPAPTAPPKLSDLQACCSAAATLPEGCDSNQWPTFPLWSENTAISVGCLPSWCDLRDELRGQNGAMRPFAFTLDFGSNSPGHMLVLLGFAENGNGTHLVLTYDPWTEDHVHGKGTLKWDDYEYYRKGSEYFSISGVFDQLDAVSPGHEQGDAGSQLGKETWVDRDCNAADPVAGSTPPKQATDALAAEDGRQVMLWLGAQKPEALGFRNVAEAAATKLGISVAHYTLSSAALEALALDSNSDPTTGNVDHVYYSVETTAPPNPGPRAMLIVGKTDEGWSPQEYGNGPLAQAVNQALSSWPLTSPLLLPDHPFLRQKVALLSIPSRNLHLLYFKDKKAFTLVERVPGLPKPGLTAPKKLLFQKLTAQSPNSRLEIKELLKRRP